MLLLLAYTDLYRILFFSFSLPRFCVSDYNTVVVMLIKASMIPT